jgi:hypothetical protein
MRGESSVGGVSYWPTIAEPELRRRLCFDDEQFREFVREFVGSVPRRELTDELFAHALAYPWGRPASSFVLRGDSAHPLDELDAAERERALSLAGAPGRHALLAFGSNGAPERLALKFKELPADERDLLVLAGTLHDFDVGAAPMPAFYGALPATLFPSAGAAVRASVLWVSDVQLTALAWSELSYWLGRLEGVRFEPDAAHAPTVTGLLGFVSRWGALCVEDEIVAMQAVPAERPAGPAISKEAQLGHVAALVIGPDATARDLVNEVMEDFGSIGLRVAAGVGGSVRHFESVQWTRYVDGG